MNKKESSHDEFDSETKMVGEFIKMSAATYMLNLKKFDYNIYTAIDSNSVLHNILCPECGHEILNDEKLLF